MNHSDWEKHLEELPLGSGGFSPKSMKQIKERIRLDGKRKSPIRGITIAAACTLLAVVVWATGDYGRALFSSSGAADTDEQEFRLTVQYGSKMGFMSQLGSTYMLNHPKAKFEVAEPSEEYAEKQDLASYKKWVSESNADILQVPLAFVDDLAADGVLFPLDDLIRRKKLDIKELYPSAVDLVKEAGNGQMYGILDDIDMNMLIYNRSLFQSKGVPLPEKGATWDDIVRLAARFEGARDQGKPVYGFSYGYTPDPFRMIYDIGQSQGLSIVDAKGRPQVNGASWKVIWSQVSEGLRKGWISDELPDNAEQSDPLQAAISGNPFYNGRSAMTLQPYLSWYVMNEAIQQGLLRDGWDAIPLSAPTAPGKISSLAEGTVYAVNAKSANQPQALKFMEYIASKERSNKAVETGGPQMLLAAVPDAKIGEGTPIGRYYESGLDASAVLRQAELSRLPAYNRVMSMLSAKANAAVQDIAAGRSTVDEALNRLQADAEQAAIAGVSEASR
ncbi:extracellular solute-binding protein [Cohnella endophytica]|uniref:Extracellular solute-binding protein n=1 Tax=Cohnella endophytica TaxID=2419778 RepID=A0A494XBD2_9BACL|nr:extracellular solute-binding protein [Cohnella endophytica]RKP47860.1 extracellular solute-binding protein [Cohnella endophytica]